ncbi:MAG: hypothetical protein M3Q29_10545 [Chloroflexota bacterium]|nr:hypothetical protein [Chloroflexota bacterium]
MAKGLTDGERQIMAELAADADGWSDEATADDLDAQADIMAEIFAELDALRVNKRRWDAQAQAEFAAMLATPAMRAELWGAEPF